MRRPLTAFCLAEALGIAAAHYGLIQTHHLCLLGAGVFFSCGMDIHRIKRILPILLWFTIGALCMSFSAKAEDALCQWDGLVAHISGTVQKVDIKERSIHLTIAVDTVGVPGGQVENIHSKTLVQLNRSTANVSRILAVDLTGRRVSLEGRISLPPGRRNPGAFDYSLYLKGKGIGTLCSASPYRLQVHHIENHFCHALAMHKGQFLEWADVSMRNDSFSLLSGLLFGEKSAMTGDMYEAFRQSGMSHLFAVSGLHVGLLYGVVLKFTKKSSRMVSNVLVLVSVVVYAALANFSVSVLRASGMTFLSLIATFLRRRYDLVSAASAMSLILLTANPYHIFDAGFQLSFLAVYSIGVVLPFFDLKIKELADRRKKSWIRSFGRVLAPCAVVQIAMAPLTAYHFFTCAPMGFFVNPPACFLAGLMLPAGLIMFLISVIAHTFLMWTHTGFAVANTLFLMIGGIVETLSSLLLYLSAPGAILSAGRLIPAPPIGLVSMFYVGFFFYFSEMRFILLRREKHRIAAILASSSLCLAAIAPYICGVSFTPVPWHYSPPLVAFLDVGQGDSIFIRAGGRNVLVDGGGHFYSDIGHTILEPFLLRHGISHIDLACVTHADLDHKKGLQELAASMRIDTLAVPKPYDKQEERFSDIECREILYLSEGQVLPLSEGVSLRLLWPDASVPSDADDNDKSLVMLLSYRGVDILLTGDAHFEQEQRLAEPYRCDILKVAHHGSAGSTGARFLEFASPAYAVISCGKNNSYGHPAPRVVELLTSSGIMVGRTDHHGALCLRSVSPSAFVVENARRDVRWVVCKREWK